MNNKIEYIQKGDYLFPSIAMDISSGDIGKYGSMRLRFLQSERRGKYNALLLSGKLRVHLLEVNSVAKEQIEQMVKDMFAKNPAPNKEWHQMEWVRHINDLTASAEEIVVRELIYT